MLDESDYPDDVARQLLSATAEIAVCAGWLCYDAGDQATANRLYTEARLLADHAEDTLTAVRALDKPAMQLVARARESGRAGHAREAIRITRRATELARGQRQPRLHALIAAREAVAHATVGDAGAFDAAMGRAWRELDLDSGPATPGWLRFVTRAEISSHHATGLRYLGDPGSAVELCGDVLDTEHIAPRNRNNYRATLAAALAESGDVGSAVQETAAVVDQLRVGGIDSRRTLTLLRPVRDAAALLPAHREFCTEFDFAVSNREV
jgi:hypothetical protein